MPHLKTEAVLVHCNIANNDFQYDSRVLYTFIPNKSFGQLLDISHNPEFLYVEVWFTDQNSKPLEKEDETQKSLKIENIEYLVPFYA